MGDKDLTLWLRLRDDASKSLRSLLPSLKQVGLAVGLAAAAGTALSISSFVDFQTSLNNVKAVSKATKIEMGLFETQALEMGASTKFSAQEAADAQAFLAMAGLSVQEALAALPGTLQLAAAGQLDLAAAADLTTNVMSGYRMAVSDIPRINDVLATTAAAANTNVAQMGDAMSYVAPVAAAAGIEFEEASAALGRLASNSMAGERGGTALRGILIKLMTPTAALESLTDKYSLTLRDATGAMLPLNEIIGQFNAKGVKSEEVLALFGARAGPGMLALLAEGAESLRGYAVDLEDVGDAAKIMAETQQEGIVGAMTNMQSAASTLSIVIGKELEPAFVDFATTATSGMSWLVVNIGAVIAEAKAIAGAVAAGFTAAGLAYLALNARMVAFTIATNVAKAAMIAFNIVTNLNPLTLLVTAIGAAVAAYVYWSDEINGFLVGAWNKYVTAIEAGIDFLRPLADMIGIDLPESMGKFKFKVDDSTVSTETFTEAVEAAVEAAPDLSTVVTDVGVAAAAADTEISDLTDTVSAASRELNDFYAMQTAFRAEAASTTAWLKQQQADRVADAQAAASQELNDFYDIQQTTRTELSADAAWLEDLYTTTGTKSSAGFLNSMTSTFANAFAGGGGFMGGLQSVMTQGWGKLFVGEGETAATGFLGKMQGVMGALGGVPLVGPLLAAFGPALISGIGKLAGKIWGGIKSLFGGPSKQEQLGRDLFANFHAGIAPELKNSEAYIADVQTAIANGWDRTLAETQIAWKHTAAAAGLSADVGWKAYEQYQHAVKDGNTELMLKLEADYAEWERMAAETASANAEVSEESTAEIVHDAAEIADQFKGLSTEEAAQLGAALLDLGAKANFSFTQIHDSARATGAMLANELLPQLYAVARAIGNIPTDITIRTSYVTEGGAIPGRQHGGPVSAGRPYVVGEGGRAEIFVPGQSGSVVPNKSIPTAEEIGAAVARAMQRTPLVVPRDAVTDAVLGNSPSRRALAGYD